MHSLNSAVTIALGSLTIWHVKLIKRGETSIESHINMSETKRLAALGKIYTNPYDFGPRKNLLLFLGLVRKRYVLHKTNFNVAHIKENFYQTIFIEELGGVMYYCRRHTNQKATVLRGTPSTIFHFFRKSGPDKILFHKTGFRKMSDSRIPVI